MSDGYVDETWAKEHHLYWYNDIKAGKIPTAPDDVPVGTKHARSVLPSPR
jgi:formate dehydrogenase subunit gamma